MTGDDGDPGRRICEVIFWEARLHLFYVVWSKLEVAWCTSQDWVHWISVTTVACWGYLRLLLYITRLGQKVIWAILVSKSSVLDFKWVDDANYCACWICGVPYLGGWACLIYFRWMGCGVLPRGLFQEIWQVNASDRGCCIFDIRSEQQRMAPLNLKCLFWWTGCVRFVLFYIGSTGSWDSVQ